ncbi:MAG: hypothetical protein ACKVT1_07835 [Dehalococcoidia bacterium]
MFGRLILTSAIALAVAAAACNGGDKPAAAVIDAGDGADYRPDLNPANFVTRIDNPYLPFIPGSRWVYESGDGSERIEVVVLTETRQVAGITATIVRDTVTEDGEVIEDTFDWYAQDKDGAVWYLGEDSREMKDGKVTSTKGSWETGVDGALPGIVMLAKPTQGAAYRQEYYKGEAEDLAQIERVDVTETVNGTKYDRLVVTHEWNPLDPEVIEEKYYAPGVGFVLEVKVRGSKDRLDLVSFQPGK